MNGDHIKKIGLKKSLINVNIFGWTISGTGGEYFRVLQGKIGARNSLTPIWNFTWRNHPAFKFFFNFIQNGF